MYGVDDSIVLPPVRRWLAGYCRDSYAGWGNEADGEGLTKCWSGIICQSVDLLPLVGPVPGRPGIWVAAGYNGHGMARIHNVTRGLANHLKSGHWDDRVPRTFEITPERLERARQRALNPVDYPVSGLRLRPREQGRL